ncbi:Ammonium transporter 2 member 1 [Hibiscus syriacus]|uniref:Ammonium transporter 2 member 1 n=1 Tax=Hibiscus syriacus TaxID=106335 RepID=A0A6A3B6Z7_HIBSY|nr:Ammonium transporter 2 member 1 [Hibiscus syriacus]
MTASTLVGIQSMPGLVILYASIVKKKWAVNSAFMALYAFAVVLICWVLLCYRMAFGDELLPFLGERAWMSFAPLWLIFSYTVGACSFWGGGFIYRWGAINYSGGYMIHLSSGVSGLTAAYWVGPSIKSDRERFIPNNILLILTGAGLLGIEWSGFNGGAPYAASIDSSIAVLNTNVSAATSFLVWTCLDVVFFGKPSVIGVVHGMITGLACIMPGACLLQSWATIIIGMLAGSVPWASMMIIHKKCTWLQKVDDALGVFHTHAVAGLMGGLLMGLLAEPHLCRLILPKDTRCALYGGNGGVQLAKQIVAALFVIGWNVTSTLILLMIRLCIPLRMPDNQLEIGDDSVHGEEAYTIWGDGEQYDQRKHGWHAMEKGEPITSRPPSVDGGAAADHHTRSKRNRSFTFGSTVSPATFDSSMDSVDFIATTEPCSDRSQGSSSVSHLVAATWRAAVVCARSCLTNDPKVLKTSCTVGLMDDPNVLKTSCTIGLMVDPKVLKTSYTVGLTDDLKVLKTSCTEGLTDDPKVLKTSCTEDLTDDPKALKTSCTLGLADDPKVLKTSKSSRKLFENIMH